MCINQGVNIFSLQYFIEYMICLLLTYLLVVMETNVSTLVIWLFWKFIEGIRLNVVLVPTKFI